MADKKISALPSGTANASAVVPATNAAGTTTEKITLGAIAALGGGPPASHTHGNISNAGAIGTTSGLPVKTGTSGVLEAGAFGTGSGQFCQGNDSRLSDARTPTTHASTHATGQSDALTPANIGAAYAPIHSITASDQTVSGDSLTDATNMSFTAAASTTYLVDMLLIAEDINGGNVKAVVDAGGADLFGYWPLVDSYYIFSSMTSVGDIATILQGLENTGPHGIYVQFVVKTAGTSKTVKLQFAQSSGGGDGAKLHADSYIVARRIS